MLNEDREAFRELVVMSQKMVYNLAYRFFNDPEMAREISQETFVRAYQNLKSFCGQSKFSTWVCTIARNLCIDVQKKRRKLPIDCNLDDMPVKDRGMSPFQRVEDSERQSIVQAELARISPVFREVLILRVVQDCSYEEIALICAIPVATVKTRLHRGKLELAERLHAREVA